ncbi:hypothetical protein C3L55_04585 [Veillonellaceae bacterium M1-70]|nr:hypothetical protein [Veillonellaceae bacterium M1-70]
MYILLGKGGKVKKTVCRAMAGKLSFFVLPEEGGMTLNKSQIFFFAYTCTAYLNPCIAGE